MYRVHVHVHCGFAFYYVRVFLICLTIDEIEVVWVVVAVDAVFHGTVLSKHRQQRSDHQEYCNLRRCLHI